LAIGIAPLESVRGIPGGVMWASLVIVAFFTNWRERIERGAQGELSPGKAFWTGLFALVVCVVMSGGNDRAMWFAAGTAAAASLVVQAVAWLFPLSQWLGGRPAHVSPPRSVRGLAGRRHRTPRALGSHAAPIGAERYQDDEAVEHGAPAAEPNGGHLAAEVIEASTGPPRRWAVTRIGGAVVGFSLLVAFVVLLLVQFGPRQVQTTTVEWISGEVHHTQIARHITQEERVGAITGCVACLGLALFAFRKMTRHRTGGFYRDTLRPLLLTAAACGIAFGLGMLRMMSITGRERLSHDEVVAAKVCLALSIVVLVILLVKRGRRWQPGDHSKPALQEPSDHVESETPADAEAQA
jgi:hypothetical protein